MPRYIACLLLIGALSAHISVLGLSQEKAEPKMLRVFVEGDSSTIPKLEKELRNRGPEHGLDFTFVDKQSDPYDLRIVLSSEGSSLWDYAHGSVVVMTPEGKVLFTTMRANRWTAKGAVNALSKEVVKNLQRHYNTRGK